MKLPIRAWATELVRWWNGQVRAERPTPAEPPALPRVYRRLRHVVLTDEVCRTLFDDFERHRETTRGEEEVGWVLIGLREEEHAVALAALPAGAEREASLTHIRFNSDAQAVASRWLRQTDRRLGMLGVVHTHPGSLRHPSGGDYRGDLRWVPRLRGKEGVFGIGTADAHGDSGLAQPEPNRQERGRLCFSWYSLAPGDGTYRRLPVELTLGADFARPLVPVWPLLERHAADLEQLCVQQAGVRFELVGEGDAAALSLLLPLADGKRLRVMLRSGGAQYYVESSDSIAEVDPKGDNVAHSAYLILAELSRHT
jgi:proteasome lid subunit RPN8/RPN11